MPTIPIGQFKARCPECEAYMLVEHDGTEDRDSDKVFCPACGHVESVADARRRLAGQNGP
jgi:uncharacterized Zn finger protein (UPF0148 family)